MAFSKIKISSFRGQAIKPYLASLARLRIEVFKDYPYLRENSLEYETSYLKKYTETPDSIAVIVFEGSTPVGVSMGMPLEAETDEVRAPLEKQGLNPSDYFYLGKSVLLKPYRGRGMGHHFFEIREDHARALKRFKQTCFWDVVRPDNHRSKPQDFLSLVDFWRKQGYVKNPELTFTLSWPDINDDEPSAKEVVYWTKDLKT